MISKRRYAFMIWGRLSYEPGVGNDLFERSLAVRFPGVSSAALFRAWSEASRVFPWITRFFSGDIDLKWFPKPA